MISLERLRYLVTYNHNTGEMTWNISPCGRVKAGDKVGCINEDGYYKCRIDKKDYIVHRLAWYYFYGEMPLKIDHINHDRTDNRIENLRNVSTRDNNRNASISNRNSSGYVGVSRCRNKWRAFIDINGKYISLGTFSNLDDAIEARQTANKKYGFHKNHGGVKID